MQGTAAQKNKFLLIAVIMIAVGLRVFGITWGLPGKDYYFSYHSDEVHYLRGLSQMEPAKFDLNPHYFNWGTWHYYELGGIIGLAGILDIVKLSKDKYFYYKHPWEMAKIYLAGRFLSVFFALLTIILVYLIGKKIYSVKAGLLAAFFMAINPAHIVHSHYLKADASVTFWVTLLLLSSIYLMETAKLRWYILSGIFSAMAVGSQGNGICFIHTIFFAHLLKEYNVPAGQARIKNILISKRLLIGYLAALVTYLIINPYLYLSTDEFISGFPSIIFRKGGGPDTIERVSILVDTIRAFNVSFTPFFVFLGLAGIAYAIASKAKKNLLVLIWLLPYLSVIVGWGVLNTRHQLLIFPGIFVLSAGFIFFFDSNIRNKITRLFLRVVIILACLYTICYAYAYDRALSKKPIQQEASEWLILNVPAKTEIGIPGSPEIRHYPAIVHQDYYYNENSRYKIVNLDSNVDKLKSEQPEYFIVDQRAGFYYDKTDFSSGLINKLEDRYRIVKIFERYPSFFLFVFKPKIYIPDWEMPFPAILVLKNKI